MKPFFGRDQTWWQMLLVILRDLPWRWKSALVFGWCRVMTPVLRVVWDQCLRRFCLVVISPPQKGKYSKTPQRPNGCAVRESFYSSQHGLPIGLGIDTLWFDQKHLTTLLFFHQNRVGPNGLGKPGKRFGWFQVMHGLIGDKHLFGLLLITRY